MTRQVLDLTGLNHQSGWRGAVLIDPGLVAGGGVAYLRYIERVGNSIRVRLAAAETEDPLDAGPEFTAALETHDEALTFAGSDGATVTLKGPGHGDNSFADPTEPYFWTPDNGAAMNAWFTNRSGDFTLTLDDGVTEIVREVGGTAAAGAAETVATVDRVPQLALADFDAAGLEVDVLALIRAGAGPNNTLYAAPPRGTVGALLEGDMGLGESEVAITRIRRRNGTMLVVNDNDALSLAKYFGSGGAGADLTLYVQTLAGVASIAVSAHARAGGNMIHFGAVDSDFQALLDGIADGDRFIFALARPARAVVAVRGSAEAGAPEAAARVSRVARAIRRLRGTAAAGGASASASVLAQRVRAVRGVAATGATSARARLSPIAVRAIRGRVQAGGAVARAAVRVRASETLFKRWQREAAPVDRVVTALEIRHPAVPVPVRVVNDTVNRRIEGSDYVALRFDARLADDIAGQAPQAELAIDNVGRALTQWIEAAGGGIGATVRVMLVLAVPDPPVEWELTLDVAGINVDQERVTVRLGFDPLLGGAAVTLRHDPQTSPGLF